MSDPIHISLSPFQQQQFADIQTRLTALQTEEQVILKTLIGGVVDPASIGQHVVSIENGALVLTPPAEG